MLTTLIFALGLVMLWRKPSWGRLAKFAALILLVYVTLVWASSGFYLNAASLDLGERWSALLVRGAIWLAAFFLLGAIVINVKRRMTAPGA